MAVFTGTNIAETIVTTSGNDTVTALGGNDWIVMLGGIDSVDGGAGIDTLSYVFANANVTVDLRKTVAQNTGFGTATITGIENISSGNGNDRLYGSTAANQLSGGNGNDYLWGNSGNDYLIGGLGNDRFIGGAGLDTASFQDSASGVFVNLGVTVAQNTGEGFDTLQSIETVYGSAFDDELTGNGRAVTLVGGNGDDYLDGKAFGEIAVLIGGDGRDIFAFTVNGSFSGLDSFFGNYVTDFTKGDDIIDMSAYDGLTPFNELAITTTATYTQIDIVIPGNDITVSMRLNGIIALTEDDLII